MQERKLNSNSEVNLDTSLYKNKKITDKNLNMNKLPNKFERKNADYSQNYIGNYINSKPHSTEHSRLNDPVYEGNNSLISQTNISIYKSEENNKSQPAILESAKYFSEVENSEHIIQNQNSNLKQPEGYLIEPFARKGTSQSMFGLGPCGGGTPGSSNYIGSPGETTKVQWTIKNPVKNGFCQISLSRGHPDDIDAYQILPVISADTEVINGKFECGDPTKAVESATVEMPLITCSECTLQWIYHAPGFGSIYKCADISILFKSEVNECLESCQNRGVCIDGQCFCASGYFGEFCDHHGHPNTFYESLSPQPSSRQSDSTSFFTYLLLFLLSLFLCFLLLLLIKFLFVHLKSRQSPSQDSSSPRVFSPSLKMRNLVEEADSEEVRSTSVQFQREVDKRELEDKMVKEIENRRKSGQSHGQGQTAGGRQTDTWKIKERLRQEETKEREKVWSEERKREDEERKKRERKEEVERRKSIFRGRIKDRRPTVGKEEDKVKKINSKSKNKDKNKDDEFKVDRDFYESNSKPPRTTDIIKTDQPKVAKIINL